jgi:enediyne biosynthesis protein E4
MVRFLLAALVTTGAALSIFEVRTPHGVGFVHQNSPTSSKYLIETMGGGVALFDYNNDGRLDVLLVNSGSLAPSMQPPAGFRRSLPQYWNRLYRQEADGTFTDVTRAAGLADAGDANYGMGVTIGDYDNDGYEDIYITNYGKNSLLHNNRDGTFTDVTGKAGVAGGGWSASAGFFDYDNDGHLDLFVTRYMQWSPAESKVCGGEYHTYCTPGTFPATTNILYHNNGDGTFTDVSQASGIAAKPGRSLGVAFNDYDGDGFQDIFVANDGMEEFLFHNNGNGTFTERAQEAGVALTDDGSPYAGMGVDFRDYDNDGKPDILVTNLARQIYALYHNDGDGSFSYHSLQTGLATLSAGSSGWGVGLVDFDNDGWKDMFVAQSHVMDNVEKINPAMHYKEPPLFALNHQGRFERADSGTAVPVAGRGAAFGDLNHDGSIDVVMSVLGAAPEFFYNRGNRSHWLTLTMAGTRSNRDGIGARVVVNGQTQTVTTAGSYLSASDKRVHFGLGDAAHASVEVFWPSGVHQVLKDVSADQFLTVEEPRQP